MIKVLSWVKDGVDNKDPDDDSTVKMTRVKEVILPSRTGSRQFRNFFFFCTLAVFLVVIIPLVQWCFTSPVELRNDLHVLVSSSILFFLKLLSFRWQGVRVYSLFAPESFLHLGCEWLHGTKKM